MAIDHSPLMILHIGLGSFHRAHQAVYLQRLISAGDERWSLAGGNIRDDMQATIKALIDQNGEYTLETVGSNGHREYQRIRSIQRVVAYSPDLCGLIDIGKSADTRIISFTVTEAGYYLGQDGSLDLRHAAVAADIDAARAGRVGSTIYSGLAAILRARMAERAGKITLLCCDNLRSNGKRSRSGLLQFVSAAGDAGLHDWIQECTTSPNAMVDRITPRPPVDLRQRVLEATGWIDAAPVIAEDYIQWVIEDEFCNDRPEWERVGAEIVPDVHPYEEAKIRILNACHSCVAWGGTLVGTRYIHEGARNPTIRRLAFEYITKGVLPCLTGSPIDLMSYRDAVLERFCNEAIVDTNQRVAADSFSKLRSFIAPTVCERLSAGENIASVASLPALFMLFLERWHNGALSIVYSDQPSDIALARSLCQSSDPIAALCADRSVWGDAAGDARLLNGVRSSVEDLRQALPA